MGFSTGGGGSSGAPSLPEAPPNGLLYGRRNLAWQPATAPLVTLQPDIAPWLNVQEALEGVITDYVKRSGDIMTGGLTVPLIDASANLPIHVIGQPNQMWLTQDGNVLIGVDISLERPLFRLQVDGMSEMRGRLEIRSLQVPATDEDALICLNDISRSIIRLQYGGRGSTIVMDGISGSSRYIRWQYDGADRWVWWGDDFGFTMRLQTFNPNQDVLVFDRASGLATVAGDPTASLGIATKQYTDLADAGLQRQIDVLAAGRIYVGAYDVVNDQADFTRTSGIPNGPLPPANATTLAAGDYVICTSAGTGTGNAPPVPLNVGDQLISDGPTGGPDWQVLAVGTAVVTADAVALNPSVDGWTTVQESIEGLAQMVDQSIGVYVQKAGDSMTGPLVIAAASTQSGLTVQAGNTAIATAQLTNNPGGVALGTVGRVVINNTAAAAALTLAQTAGIALETNGGINFGSVAVSSPANLTRHIRLWQETGNTGFGFSITGGRLNYVVAVTSDIHAFINPSNTAAGQEWATIGGAGVTTIGVTTSVDGAGLTTFGGGRFYKPVGTGIVIRQSSGNQQPQIENNNGTNRRDIIDTVNGDARYIRQTSGTTGDAGWAVALWLTYSAHFTLGNFANVGNNPPFLEPNSNGIQNQDGAYVATVYLPLTTYLPNGEPFYIRRFSGYAVTINNARTSMAAPYAQAQMTTVVFIRNGDLWDLVGVLHVDQLPAQQKHNSLAYSYVLPAVRGTDGQWLGTDGSGSVSWRGY